MTQTFLTSGKSTGAGTRNFTMQFCDIEGPEVPESALQDPEQWPLGYTGILHLGVKIYTGTGLEWDTVIEDCTFQNVSFGGNFTARGNFVFRRNYARNIYNDAFRFFAFADNGEAKIITDNTAEKFFPINNEMFEATGQLAPHADFMQLIGTGTLTNALVARNVGVIGRPIRGDTLQGFFTNSPTDRCVVFQNILSNRRSPWAIQLIKPTYCVIAQNTLIPSDLGAFSVRVGGASDAIGEHIYQNNYARPSTGTGFSLSGHPTEPLIFEPRNCITDVGGNVTTNFDWLGEPNGVDQLIEYATPKVGSDADTLGIGALDTSGNWKYDEWPPLAGAKPTLANAGADLLITPSASKLAYVTPTTWDIAYRNASGTPWTYVTGRTGANHTLVAPTKTGIQVMTRWIGTNGLIGPWSEAQTTIS